MNTFLQHPNLFGRVVFQNEYLRQSILKFTWSIEQVNEFGDAALWVLEKRLDVQWENVQIPSEQITRLIRKGQMGLIAFYTSKDTKGFTPISMDIAAQSGNMAIVEFLHYHRTEGCTRNAMDFAAEAGHLEIVKFLDEHRSEGCSEFAMTWAARNGHVEVVKYLHEHRSEGCIDTALNFAVKTTLLHKLREDQDILLDITVKDLKNILNALELEKSGQKHSLIKRIIDFSIYGHNKPPSPPPPPKKKEKKPRTYQMENQYQYSFQSGEPVNKKKRKQLTEKEIEIKRKKKLKKQEELERLKKRRQE
eukprot:Pgem_evm1s10036